MASNYTRRIIIWINGKEVLNTVSGIKEAIAKLTNKQAKLEINSKEYLEAGKKIQMLNGQLKEHRETLKPIPTSWEKIKTAMTGSYAALLGYGAAIMGVVYSFKKFYDAAEEQAKADKRLMFAVNGNIEAFNELKRQQDELRDATGIKDETISQIQMMGMEAGLTVEDVKKLTEASINLSSITGKDLQATYMGLMRTLAGNRKGIAFLGKDFTDLTAEQLKHGAAIDLVIKKYGGMAAASALDIDKLSTNWEEFMELGGNILSKIANPVLEMANAFLKAVNPAKSMVETLTEEKNGLSALVYQIQDTNTNQEERNRLIEDLRKKYPDFLGSLTNEQVTNDLLARSLENVNVQYTEKIRLANSEKTLDKLAKKQSDAMDKLNDAERDRNMILAESMDLLYQSNAPAASLVEKATSLAEKVKLVNKYWGAGGGTTGTAGEFLAAAAEAEKAEKKMKAAQKDFSEGSIKIAEDAVNSSLNATNSLSNVSTEILNIALKTNDQLMKQIVQAELFGRKIAPKSVSKFKDSDDQGKPGKPKGEVKWSLDNDVAFFEARKKLYDTYAAGEIVSEDDYNTKLTELEMQFLDARIKTNQDKGDDLLKLKRDMIDKGIDLVNAGKKREEALQKAANEGLSETDQLTADYDTTLKELGLYYKKVEDMTELEMKALAGVKKTYQDKIDKITLENSKKALDDKLQSDLLLLNEGELKKEEDLKKKRDNGEISQRKYHKELLVLQNQYKTDSLNISVERAQRELDILKALGVDTTQAEAALAEAKLKAQQQSTTGNNAKGSTWEDWDSKDRMNMALDAAGKIADASFQISKDKHQRELDDKLSALEKERDAELSNKNLTESQKDAINNKYAAKERTLKQKAWRQQHTADLAQAWVNLALGIGKAAINLWPVPAIPMMAMAAIDGGMQVAAVASQTMPEFSEGGFTLMDHSNKRPAGIVHANEYVVPEEGTSNPNVRRILDVIEMARMNGNLATVDVQEVLKSTARGGNIMAFESGGYTTARPKSQRNSIIQETRNNELLKYTLDVVKKLNDKLDEGPLKAEVALLGKGNLYEKMEEETNLRDNANL